MTTVKDVNVIISAPGGRLSIFDAKTDAAGQIKTALTATSAQAITVNAAFSDGQKQLDLTHLVSFTK
jgi:hypothetical protein